METRSAPARRDRKAMLEKVNIDDAFAKTVGMRVVEFLPGYAKVLIEVIDHHLDFFPMVHEGVIFSIVKHAPHMSYQTGKGRNSNGSNVPEIP
jgi:acyl-coenzyme A thioesterase PaaI-like protein